MFNKKIILGEKKVEIAIFDSPVMESENKVLFGYPLEKKQEFLYLNSNEFGNQIKGSWLKIDLNKNSITILTDILGGYRLYYKYSYNSIVISDNYQYLINNNGEEVTLHEEEYLFWKKHRYTSGGSTLISGIKKINPASSLVITEKKITEKSYFKDINRNSNFQKHTNAIHKDLDDTFLKIKQCNQ